MSKFIQTKYQQYKSDTRNLSTWLATTALNYGFPVESLTRPTTPSAPTLYDAVVEGRTAQQLKNAKKKAKQRAKGKDRVEQIKEDQRAELPEPITGK